MTASSVLRDAGKQNQQRNRDVRKRRTNKRTETSKGKEDQKGPRQWTMDATVVVGGVGWLTAGMALVYPRQMLKLWPESKEAEVKLMRAWAISTLALSTTAWGLEPTMAIVGVCLASIPWDLEWGGPMGKLAALINMACAVSLLKK